MSSLFIGKTGLRHRYRDALAATINATTGASDAILIETFTQAARLAYLFNNTPADLALWVTHPDADNTVTANRLLWFELPANFNMNYDFLGGQLTIDPGTTLFVSKASGTASSGKFRLIYFG